MPVQMNANDKKQYRGLSTEGTLTDCNVIARSFKGRVTVADPNSTMTNCD